MTPTVIAMMAICLYITSPMYKQNKKRCTRKEHKFSKHLFIAERCSVSTLRPFFQHKVELDGKSVTYTHSGLTFHLTGHFERSVRGVDSWGV